MAMKLITDGAVLDNLLRGPTGQVFRYMSVKATEVQVEAKKKANKKSGCMADSVVKRTFFGTPEGFEIHIQCDTRPCSPSRTAYAYYIHEGTKPHDIPNAFGWGPTFGIGGRFDGRFHPGYPGNPFLRDALKVLA
jgi:hypothetical protein